jgi:TM2 domain-containing membrane protein YozV
VVTPDTQAPPVGMAVKSKVAAGLLGIFLGALGVHRFYLGYIVIGVAQLLLTVLGFWACGIGPIAAGIWGLVEGIMILAGSIDRDAKGRPLAE